MSRHSLLLVFALAVGFSWNFAIAAGLPQDKKADRVLVVKNDRTMTLLRHGAVLKTYKIALGGSPVGPKTRQGDHKTRQGDHKTPEGIYSLDSRNAHSRFYRSIHISYPNAEDRRRARKLGVSSGGDIFLHGLPNGFGWLNSTHRLKDWTDGCIAVSNDEMDEIWSVVPNGTPIEIRP